MKTMMIALIGLLAISMTGCKREIKTTNEYIVLALPSYQASTTYRTNGQLCIGKVSYQLADQSKKLSEKVVTDALRYAFTHDANKVFDRFIR